MTSYKHILPEITQRLQPTTYYDILTGRDVRVTNEPFPEFPATCPACGAARVNTDGEEWRHPATYACGADYTPKPQIQNHTDKWWGICPASKDA